MTLEEQEKAMESLTLKAQEILAIQDKALSLLKRELDTTTLGGHNGVERAVMTCRELGAIPNPYGNDSGVQTVGQSTKSNAPLVILGAVIFALIALVSVLAK